MGAVTDLKVQLDVESAKFRAEIEKVAKSVDTVAGKLTKLNEKVGGGATDVLKGIASWNALSGAISKAGHFLIGGIKGFAAEEQASLRLSSALTTLGYNASALLGPLEAQQRMFEGTTTAQGETVAQMQQLMLQYGVAPKDIERTTQAILDYSAATGDDALSSTDALLKAVNAGKDGVKSLGVRYNSTGDAATDLGIAVDQLETKFAGSAQAATSGLAGQLDQLTKAQENLGKAFGEFFSTMEQKTGLIGKLTEALRGAQNALFGDKQQQGFEQRSADFQKLQGEKTKFEEKYKTAEKQLMRMDRSGVLDFTDAQKANMNPAERKTLAEAQATYDDLIRQTDFYSERISEVDAQLEKLNKTRAESGTGITAGVSKTAKDANKPTPDKPTIDVSASPGGAQSEVAALRPFESIGGLHLEKLQELGKQLTAAMRTPLEAFRDEIKDLDKLWDAGAVSAETYNRALKDATTRYKDAADKLLDTSLADLGREGLGRMGKIGDVAGAATGSLAKSATGALQGAGAGAVAGPLGAVIGVLASILTESKAFMQLLSLAAEVVQVMADALGPVIDPINRVVAALEPLAKALGVLHGPIGMIVDVVLRSVVPVLVVLGSTFSALEPLIQMLCGVVTIALMPILLQFDAALYGFFYAVKYAGLAVLEVVGFLAPFWNGIVGAIQKVFTSIANFDVAGAKPFGFLNDWSKSLEKGIVNTDEVNAQKEALNKLDWESAQAKADEIAATKKVTDAANEAASSLFNLPAGYKIEAARFAAAAGLNSMNVPAFADGGVVSRAQLALVGEGGEPEVIAPESMLRRVMREEGGRGGPMRLQVFLDGREIHARIKQYAERDRYNATGEIG